MLNLSTVNKILTRFGYNVISEKYLESLIYSSSFNKNIMSPQASSIPDPFEDQRYLIKTYSPIIFDVGSHVGEVACKYANIFPDSIIYAFEPTLNSFNRLKAKTRKIKNIQAFNLALSDINDTCKFYLNRFSPTNSILAPSTRASQYWGEGIVESQDSIRVDCRTIDEFCSREQIDHLDILKLDVQGAELRVLKGADGILEQGRIGLIYTEIIFVETYDNQTTLTDLLQLMDRKNYRLFNLYNPRYLDRRLIQADLIFVHHKHLQQL